MPTGHIDSTTRLAESHQLSPFPSTADLREPLLNLNDDSGVPLSPATIQRRRRQSSRNPLRACLKRWWTPLLIISLPPLLLLLYSYIHPHVPGLPPLPKVHISTGDESRPEVYQEVEVHRCTCGITDNGQRLCDIYGERNLGSSRLVQGSGARLRSKLVKAREGAILNIGVLGGSVSACHGVHPSPQFPQGDPDGPGCYTTLVKKWFADNFPGVEHNYMNGAVGGMDSSYYAFCGTHHIMTNADIVILEFDVNDQADATYQTFFDQLVRVLLEFKSQPAVLILGAWSPQVAQDQGYGDPQIVHSPIAHYYDIPYISLKRIVFDHYLRFPKSTAQAFYQPDQLHPNARGHRVLADLLIAFLESELCMVTRFGLPVIPDHDTTISTTSPFSHFVDIPFPIDTLHLIDPVTPPPNWESAWDLTPLEALTSESRHFISRTTPYDLPLVGVFTPLRDVVDPKKPDPEDGEHVLSLVQPKMFCADANDHDNPMKPYSHDGWRPFVWNGEKHFWVSDTPGAKIRVDIQVNAGRVAVYYYRSQRYGLGDAHCWVDDNRSGAVTLHGYWSKQYNVAVVAYIDEKVTPGDHYVTCEISKNTSHPDDPNAHHFRIVAVMAT